MITLKCKMCGATLPAEFDNNVATCEYCGSVQTVPVADDEKKISLFLRANKLRFNCEFDKASVLYESIIQDFPEEAEAYWGLVLCKYGIEYIDDEKTGKKIPTCHRTRPMSVLEDDDFNQAYENAENNAREIYRSEAKEIDRIQKRILEVAANEAPYDIFICYKETDEQSGTRTKDSEIAQDIYTELTGEGYRVFFSRITLRSVAGTEYEPYIYSALSSAKIMLAIGTKYEYYDAVWVKNEWSRYLDMMRNDTAKMLIPLYRDMDAYDMPKEFKNLQGLNLSDVTFFKNLLNSIENSIGRKKEENVPSDLQIRVESLVKRTYLFVNDGEYEKAAEYVNRIWELIPEYAECYLIKLLIQLNLRSIDDLKNLDEKIDDYENYQIIVRLGDKALVSRVTGIAYDIKEKIYSGALDILNGSETPDRAIEASEQFAKVSGYKDADAKKNECIETAERLAVSTAVGKLKAAKTVQDYLDASELFKEIENNKVADDKFSECLAMSKNATVLKYTKAIEDLDNASTEAQFLELAKVFESISTYADSANMQIKCREKAHEALMQEKEAEYNYACEVLNSAQNDLMLKEAIALFGRLGDYKDSKTKAQIREEDKQLFFTRNYVNVQNAYHSGRINQLNEKITKINEDLAENKLGSVCWGVAVAIGGIVLMLVGVLLMLTVFLFSPGWEVEKTGFTLFFAGCIIVYSRFERRVKKVCIKIYKILIDSSEKKFAVLNELKPELEKNCDLVEFRKTLDQRLYPLSAEERSKINRRIVIEMILETLYYLAYVAIYFALYFFFTH